MLGYYAHLTPMVEYILVGVAAGATFVAVLAGQLPHLDLEHSDDAARSCWL